MRGAVAVTAVLLVAACAKSAPPPFAECEELLGLVEKVSSCPAIATDARTRLSASARTMRATISQLASGGGPTKAPPELVELLRDSCRAQLASLQHDPKLAACAK